MDTRAGGGEGKGKVAKGVREREYTSSHHTHTPVVQPDESTETVTDSTQVSPTDPSDREREP